MDIDVTISASDFEEQVAQYIHYLMEQKINFYLEYQLKGAVEAHFASKRLTSDNSYSLQQTIDSAIRHVVDDRIREIVPSQLRILLREHFDKLRNSV